MQDINKFDDEEGVVVTYDRTTELFTVEVTKKYSFKLEPKPFKNEKEMNETLEAIAYEATEAVDEYVEEVAEDLGAIEGTETGFSESEDD